MFYWITKEILHEKLCDLNILVLYREQLDLFQLFQINDLVFF